METINIARLKQSLSRVLRRVRNGEEITILDRQTPVAILSSVKSDKLTIAKTAREKLRPPKSISSNLGLDALKMLREDRDRR